MSNSKILMKAVYWIIEIPEKRDVFIQSKDTFSTHFNMEFNNIISLWRLYYNPNYRNENAFYVFLECGSDSEEIQFDCEFCVSIVNTSFADTRYILSHEWTNQNEACNSNESCGICLIPSDVLIEQRNLLCPDGKLCLKFTISTFNIINEEGFVISNTPRTSDQQEDLKVDFTKNFSKSDSIFNMITTAPESDVLINTEDGMTLKAHKSVLSKKSTVFQKMLAIDMDEATSKSIDVIEFKGPVMQELLRFIYFGNVQNIEQIDIELLKAAKAYKIEELAKICMRSIIAGINYENVIEIVKFADVYGLIELFNLCCDKIQCMPHCEGIKEKLKDVDFKLQVKILNEIIDRITKTEMHVTVETSYHS